MLIDLAYLRQEFDLKISGVVHVGAHLAEEGDLYDQLGIKKIAWVEANSDLLKKITRKRPNDLVIQAVVSVTDDEEVTFYKANNGQSSSILELDYHSIAHPEVHYVAQETVRTKTLKSVIVENNLEDCNFLNLDIQGNELRALQGAGDLLDNFDYIYSEVNKKSLYKDCALFPQIRGFLQEKYSVVDIAWTTFGWGDAFWVKRDLL